MPASASQMSDSLTVSDRVRHFFSAPFYNSGKLQYSQGEFLLTLMGGMDTSVTHIENRVLEGIQDLHTALQDLGNGKGDLNRHLQILSSSPLTLEAAQHALEEMKPVSKQQEMSKEFLRKGLQLFSQSLQQAFPDLLQSPTLWRDRLAGASSDHDHDEPRPTLAQAMHILLHSCYEDARTPATPLDKFLDMQKEHVEMAKQLAFAMAMSEQAPQNMPTDTELTKTIEGLKLLTDTMRKIADSTPDKNGKPTLSNSDLIVLKKWAQAVGDYKDTMSRFWDAHESVFQTGQGKEMKEQLCHVMDGFIESMTNIMEPVMHSIGSPYSRA